MLGLPGALPEPGVAGGVLEGPPDAPHGVSGQRVCRAPRGRRLTRALPRTREDAASLLLQGSVALPGDSLVLPTPGACGLPRAAGPAPGAEPVGPVSGRRPPAWPVSRPGLSPSSPRLC